MSEIIREKIDVNSEEACVQDCRRNGLLVTMESNLGLHFIARVDLSYEDIMWCMNEPSGDRAMACLEKYIPSHLKGLNIINVNIASHLCEQGYNEPPLPPMNKKYPRQWERIDYLTDRLKVFGGWVIQNDSSTIFVPDPNHEWELEDEL